MNKTKINWTPELIAEQERRNHERDSRLRAERLLARREEHPAKKKSRKKAKRHTQPYTRRAMPVEGIVYIIRLHGLYKIGKTNKYERREKELMKEFKAQSIFVFRLIVTQDMHTLERALHKQFAPRWIEREFFDLSPADLAELSLM